MIYHLRNYFSRFFLKISDVTKPDNYLFTPAENDVFLISYPRSGSTWLRVMLAEIIFGKSGDSLKDLPYYMPEISLKQRESEVVRCPFHVIKSHELFRSKNWKNKENRRIIYLIRDPRDIVISYFRFQAARSNADNFDQFVLDFSAGRIWPYRWAGHVDGWTGKGIEAYNLDILVVRYEDFIIDTYSNLCKVTDFLGLAVEPQIIHEAISNSRIGRMKEKEKLGMWENSNFQENSFIGAAYSGQWKNGLSDIQIHMINQSCEDQMKRFGYL